MYIFQLYIYENKEVMWKLQDNPLPYDGENYKRRNFKFNVAFGRLIIHDWSLSYASEQLSASAMEMSALKVALHKNFVA